MAGLGFANQRVRTRRVRFIPQMEATECGAASLAMVLDALGASTPLDEVRRACATSRDGVSAARICRAATAFGLEPTAFRAEPTALAQLRLPAILHWEFNHFVVLERVGQRSFDLVDPALGRRKISIERFSTAFTGVVLCFAPGPNLQRRPRRSLSLGRYWHLIRRFRGAWISIASSALLLEILGLAFPAANQVLIDHVLLPERGTWMFPVLLALSVSTLSLLALAALRNRVLRRLHFALDLELMVGFARHLTALPLSFFQQRMSGDLLQRVNAQSELREALVTALSGALDACLLLGYAAMMLAYDFRIGVTIILMAFLRLAIVLALRPPVANAATAYLAERAKEFGAALEPLTAPELVRALGTEHIAEQRYHGRLIARLNAEVERETLGQRARELSSVLSGLSQAAAILLGGHAVAAHQLTLGTFIGLVTLQGLFTQPLTSLVDAIGVAIRAQSVLARIDDVFETEAQARGTRFLNRVRGELQLKAVSFRYGVDGPFLCHRLNLRISPGEKVAIVGRSGQGKSTLLRLMTGLLSPCEGRVLLDGVPIDEIAPETLGRQLGVVLQDPYLFDDSVRANLTMSWPDAPEAMLKRALQVACFGEVVAGLPEGFETAIGDSGSRLSGGERQRLALARALLPNPRVLVLDEATSSLDVVTEAKVHENLGRLGCTRVLTAHRMETVRDADRILVFEQGEVVQEGTCQSLRRVPGLFRELLESYERGLSH